MSGRRPGRRQVLPGPEISAFEWWVLATALANEITRRAQSSPSAGTLVRLRALAQKVNEHCAAQERIETADRDQAAILDDSPF